MHQAHHYAAKLLNSRFGSTTKLSRVINIQNNTIINEVIGKKKSYIKTSNIHLKYNPRKF